MFSLIKLYAERHFRTEEQMYRWLSYSKITTMTDVLANPEKPWEWSGLSCNPSISMKDVLANPEQSWDWGSLSWNSSTSMKDR
jgi:hypothetical protein